jgi:hypothetical protein
MLLMAPVQFPARHTWKSGAVVTTSVLTVHSDFLQPFYDQTRHEKYVILRKTLLFLSCMTAAPVEEPLVNSVVGN